MEFVIRPKREVVHMAAAFMWASRSLCKRMRVGCVLTTMDMRRTLAVGYNGPAKGLSNGRCRSTPGSCGCLHAEDNAVAISDSIPQKTAFVTHAPCETCAQRLVQANVHRVLYVRVYRSEAGLDVLRELGVEVTRMPEDVVGELVSSHILKAVSSPSTSKPTD